MWFDGELVQVKEFDGRRVLVHCEREGTFRSVGLAAFAASARAHPEQQADPAASLVLAGLSPGEAARIEQRAGRW